jgi:hypothetical protein
MTEPTTKAGRALLLGLGKGASHALVNVDVPELRRLVLAIEQEAAALKVERLARAIRSAMDGDYPDPDPDLDNADEWYASPNEMAGAIAREYGRAETDAMERAVG